MSDRGKWGEVLRGLTGLRLAVYDELLVRGVLDVSRLVSEFRPEAPGLAQLEEVFAWLARHRFVSRGASGRWEARGPLEARAVFERVGVDQDREKNFAAAGSLALVKGQGDRRSQQTGLRAEAGGGVAVSDTDTGGQQKEPAPRVQTHQVEFFALEGYKL
ncbi:hypothetical protein OpiT1DRAFT_05278 [Opitutaceae bacterium TAV1]|nr:hypothetical protein OpiT1DRAFT_05278 [Opitutaceae bacterium TAV1]